MPRGRQATRRVVDIDNTAKCRLIQKMINNVQRDGKKALATKIVEVALTKSMQKLPESVMTDVVECTAEDVQHAEVFAWTDAQKQVARKLFRHVVESLKPTVEVRSKRIGGATYQVPVEVNEFRQEALAMRWLHDAAKRRGERTMHDRLAAELLDVCAGRGQAVKKKEDVRKMAAANKAFAHMAGAA